MADLVSLWLLSQFCCFVLFCFFTSDERTLDFMPEWTLTEAHQDVARLSDLRFMKSPVDNVGLVHTVSNES